MKLRIRASLWLAPAVIAAAQQAPVPVEQEPHHHLVVKNDFVLVTHVIIPPGEWTLYHTHAYDRAAVHLTANNVSFQQPEKPETASDMAKVGEISASTAREGGYTHRVHNLGPGAFEVMDIEFLHRPQDPSAAPAAAVAAENPSGRLYNWVLAPGGSSAQHSHARPYLIVAVNQMPLKMTAADGKSSAEQLKAGDCHWVEANVTHTLTNTGAAEGQIVEIELK